MRQTSLFGTEAHQEPFVPCTKKDWRKMAPVVLKRWNYSELNSAEKHITSNLSTVLLRPYEIIFKLSALFSDLYSYFFYYLLVSHFVLFYLSLSFFSPPASHTGLRLQVQVSLHLFLVVCWQNMLPGLVSVFGFCLFVFWWLLCFCFL